MNDIGILISQVSAATKETSDKFDTFSQGLVSRCNGGNTLLEEYIEKLSADKNAIQVSGTQAENEIVSLGETSKNYQEKLATASGELEALKETIAKEVENLRVYGAEAETKLVTIKTLKDIITDELLAPSSGESFIQLRTFNDKVKELKTLLIKSKDNTYNPLVSTLLSLAEGRGFSDSKILTQILAVLGKLEKSLLELRERQETDGKKTIENLKTQAVEKGTQIKTFFEMAGAALSSIKDNENIVAVAAKDVENISKDEERKQQELSYWKKICAYQGQVKEKEETFRKDFEAIVSNVSTRLLEMN